MAARQIIVPGAMPSRDANGRALPAKLRFYVPGAAYTTPKAVYTTSALDVAHAFPLLSDSAGRWPQIWADEEDVFDVAWSDQVNDALIDGFTDISPLDDAVLASVTLAQNASDRAQVAAARAEAAGSNLDTIATSAGEQTYGVGEKTFPLDQSGKGFAPGMRVVASKIGVWTDYFLGVVTGFADDDLTVDVESFEGAGTASDFYISQVPIGQIQSVAGLFGPGIAREDLRLALGIDGPETGDLAQGALFGLETQRNSVNPNTEIDIAVGQRRSSDNTIDIVLAAPITVDLTTTGLLGRDVATALATGQSWHIHLICRTDTMEVSAVASLSPTAPDFGLVAPYTKSAYVFSLPRLGADSWPASGTNIPPYVQVGDDVELGVPTNEWSGQTGSASPLLRDFHVPLGLRVKVWLYAQLNYTSGALLVFKDPDLGVPAEFGGSDQRADIRLPGSDYLTNNVQVWASTAGQVYVHCSQAGATWAAKTYGWTIPRGRM